MADPFDTLDYIRLEIAQALDLLDGASQGRDINEEPEGVNYLSCQLRRHVKEMEDAINTARGPACKPETAGVAGNRSHGATNSETVIIAKAAYERLRDVKYDLQGLGAVLDQWAMNDYCDLEDEPLLWLARAVVQTGDRLHDVFEAMEDDVMRLTRAAAAA